VLTRRRFFQAAGAGVSFAAFPFVAGGAADPLAEAMKSSGLIYVTPIKTNGEESKCQAEVWFVSDGKDMFICSETSSWRAYAPRIGLDTARIWVGDVGVWTRSDGKYKKLPRVDCKASYVEDKAEIERVLETYGNKYTMEWLVWGRRFRDGLGNGSRTMVRYTPA